MQDRINILLGALQPNVMSIMTVVLEAVVVVGAVAIAHPFVFAGAVTEILYRYAPRARVRRGA